MFTYILFQSLFPAWCTQTEEMHLRTQRVQYQPTQPDQLQAVPLPALSRDWYETRQGEQVSQQEEGEGGDDRSVWRFAGGTEEGRIVAGKYKL